MFVCPRCGNSNPKYIGIKNGKPYCRFCISFKGETVRDIKTKSGSVIVDIKYPLSNEQKHISDKVKGVRCGLAYNDDVARLIRQHNNANMIAFGANFMKLEDIIKRIDIFLSTDFEGGRHERRVSEIE